MARDDPDKKTRANEPDHEPSPTMGWPHPSKKRRGLPTEEDIAGCAPEEAEEQRDSIRMAGDGTTDF